MTKTAPVPCIVHDDGLAEEDSLAENVQRVALHPLDQFRAFQVMREAGLSEEDIAARFFITPTVVRQRLRLASVSPRLLDLYAEGTLVLEQLMAFAVTPDHDRQEQARLSYCSCRAQRVVIGCTYSDPIPCFYQHRRRSSALGSCLFLCYLQNLCYEEHAIDRASMFYKLPIQLDCEFV